MVAPAGQGECSLADLMSQIRCDAVSFQGFDSGRQQAWFVQRFPANDAWNGEAFDRAHWEHYWDCQPCSYPDRSGDLRSIVKIEDFYSARQWHSTGMYCDLYRPRGVEHELQLCLPQVPGHTSGSGRTVRLYLLHIYDRLQVSSRTAAVTRAFPDGAAASSAP